MQPWLKTISFVALLAASVNPTAACCLVARGTKVCNDVPPRSCCQHATHEHVPSCPQPEQGGCCGCCTKPVGMLAKANASDLVSRVPLWIAAFSENDTRHVVAMSHASPPIAAGPSLQILLCVWRC